MLNYQEILAKKEEIEKQLKITKQEYQEVATQANDVFHNLPEMNMQVGRFEQQIQQENIASGQSADFLTPDQKSKLNALEQAAKEVANSAKNLDDRKKELNQEINRLQAQLSSFAPVLSAQEVLLYQKNLAFAERQVENLQSTIQKHEEVIEQTQRSLGPGPSHSQKREDLLAKIAVGDATEVELTEFDQKTKASLQKYEKEQKAASKVIGTAQETIRGLNRKLAVAKEKLSSIESKKSDVRNQFLKSEVERVGEEYVELTIKLVEKFEQLVALDDLLGNATKLRVNGFGNFFIPIFNVQACDEHKGIDYSGNFPSILNAFSDRRVVEVGQAEYERITSLGVNI